MENRCWHHVTEGLARPGAVGGLRPSQAPQVPRVLSTPAMVVLLSTNQRAASDMAFSPQENRLTAETNMFSLQLLNCNLSDDRKEPFHCWQW